MLSVPPAGTHVLDFFGTPLAIERRRANPPAASFIESRLFE
jgi:hypothetical protein